MEAAEEVITRMVRPNIKDEKGADTLTTPSSSSEQLLKTPVFEKSRICQKDFAVYSFQI